MTDQASNLVLRAMAWERAKGELRSITAAYMHEEEKFNQWLEKVEQFIQEVEDYAIGGLG